MGALNWVDLSERLKGRTVIASAPGRVDCGGSTDHRLTALLCNRFRPATVNIAIDLRTNVQLKSYLSGRLLVDVEGFGSWENASSDIRFTDQFSLVNAILTHFGVSGVHVSITSQLPAQSGLGGSGAMCVALIGAIKTALDGAAIDPKQLPGIALLGHHIEDSLFGNTGLQDQLAAAFGNAHLWEWNYGANLDFTAREIEIEPSIFERHSLLAYMGEPHPSSHNGSGVLNRIKNDPNLDVLPLLARISELARTFADALIASKYERAGWALQKELEIRSKIIPNLINENGAALIKHASETGCGAKIVGLGGGGCIWGLGSESSIKDLKGRWHAALERDGKGCLLQSRLARTGLEVKVVAEPG